MAEKFETGILYAKGQRPGDIYAPGHRPSFQAILRARQKREQVGSLLRKIGHDPNHRFQESCRYVNSLGTAVIGVASAPASSLNAQLLSQSAVPAGVGPFRVDASKPTTPKEAVLKPSASGGWSSLNLKTNPKAVPQQNVNASFNHYRELAKQRNTSEKLQEKEKERQKMESEERERKKREDQKAKEEEEALMKALNNSGRTAQAPAAAAAVDSTPKETSAERQAKLKEQERLREQQCRRMEANFFEVRYARAPEENDYDSTPLDSIRHDAWSDHSQGAYSKSKRTSSTSSSSSDDAAGKKREHEHHDEIELLQQQILQAQEKIKSLRSSTQSVEKKKLKAIDDLCDGQPSPIVQSISKPPPLSAVEELPVAAAAAVAEPLPKPARPAEAKPLSHRKTAQKPVASAVVAVADIPDPTPPQAAAASLEPDFRQDLKRLAMLLPQLPGALDQFSSVHPTGHLFPQQPMKPSNPAAPKAASKVLSSTSSTFGSQVRQPAPEPISAPLPLLLSPPPPPAVASKPATAAH